MNKTKQGTCVRIHLNTYRRLLRIKKATGVTIVRILEDAIKEYTLKLR